MKRILSFLRDQLDITIQDAKSTLAFLFVAMVALLGYTLFTQFTQTHYAKVTIQQYQNTPILSRTEKVSNVLEKSHRKIEFFKFNPNTLAREDFERLGVPTHVAKTIIKYREKGGKFRFKEDLQKIYTLDPEIYASLVSWIDLPEKESIVEAEDYRAKQVKDETPTRHQPERAVKLLENFDINTADTTSLKLLKGIGSTYASRIIKFRDALGGFYNIDQVTETYGISPEALSEIKKYAFVQKEVKKIFINEAEIIKHPYLKAYQSKAIINYRNQHGKFNSIEELKKVKLLDEESLQKITPYLSF